MRTSRKSFPTSSRLLLGRDQWIDAAVVALGKGGLSAIAVEPLAAALGVTKGSFYWHFENRDGLVKAVVARWAKEGTALVAKLDAINEPPAKLRALLRVSFDDISQLKAEAALSAAANAGHPLVAPTAKKVMRQRLGYTQSIYRDLGYSAAEARHMAIIAYGTYLGCVQLASQGLLADDNASLRRQLATVERVLGERSILGAGDEPSFQRRIPRGAAGREQGGEQSRPCRSKGCGPPKSGRAPASANGVEVTTTVAQITSPRRATPL
jgi:AcrR family transcriptional regulator